MNSEVCNNASLFMPYIPSLLCTGTKVVLLLNQQLHNHHYATRDDFICKFNSKHQPPLGCLLHLSSKYWIPRLFSSLLCFLWLIHCFNSLLWITTSGQSHFELLQHVDPHCLLGRTLSLVSPNMFNQVITISKISWKRSFASFTYPFANAIH